MKRHEAMRAGPIRLPLLGREGWETWNTQAGYQTVIPVYHEVGQSGGWGRHGEGEGAGLWGEVKAATEREMKMSRIIRNGKPYKSLQRQAKAEYKCPLILCGQAQGCLQPRQLDVQKHCTRPYQSSPRGMQHACGFMDTSHLHSQVH